MFPKSARFLASFSHFYRKWFFQTVRLVKQMQSDKNNNPNNQEADQPESVLNIIRKEFFDMGGHDKEEDLKRRSVFVFLEY